eukprot:3885683-Pyramimonas_sp.AAC.1
MARSWRYWLGPRGRSGSGDGLRVATPSRPRRSPRGARQHTPPGNVRFAPRGPTPPICRRCIAGPES